MGKKQTIFLLTIETFLYSKQAIFLGSGRILKLGPPLTITKKQLRIGINIIEKSLNFAIKKKVFK